MFEEKVSPEVAALEVEKWLDAKRVNPSKREKDVFRQAIEELTEAVVYGYIVFKDDNSIEHYLGNPIEGFAEKLTYKSRLTVKDIQERTKGLKSEDGGGRVLATVSALTGVAVGVLRNLTTEDYGISQAVALFFL